MQPTQLAAPMKFAASHASYCRMLHLGIRASVQGSILDGDAIALAEPSYPSPWS